jgi:transposase-like protein
MPAGRPTKYTEDYVRIAFEVMSLGATITKLAKVIGVNADSIYEWQKKYPEFSESVQRGRDHFDSEMVEEALYKRATGYNYQVITYQTLGSSKLMLTKIVKKYMPPSVEAIRFWLSNRNPKRWGIKNTEADNKIIFYTKEDVDKMLKDEEPTIRRINNIHK